MSEPERETHDVIAAVGFPREDVGLQIAHGRGRCGEPGAVDGEGLGRGVEGGDAVGIMGEALGPDAGSRCQFEHITGWPKGFQGGVETFHLALPCLVEYLTEIEMAFPEPPGVILRSVGAVVGHLLVQQGGGRDRRPTVLTINLVPRPIGQEIRHSPTDILLDHRAQDVVDRDRASSTTRFAMPVAP